MKKYQRVDHAIRITPDGDEAVLELTSGGATMRYRVPRDIVDSPFLTFGPRLSAFMQSLSGFQADHLLERIPITVGDRHWSRIEWESFERNALIVRASAVRSRVSQIPLSFPIRILEAGMRPPVVHDALESLFFGSHREQALLDDFMHPSNLEEFRFTRQDWPTVEVLHLQDFTLSARALGEFADRAQTRLIVLQCLPHTIADAREAAQTIIDRGGPAVWLFDPSFTDWRNFYGFIVHDRPLDWSRRELGAGELFAGGGREEALRYSKIAERLEDEEVRAAIVREVVETPMLVKHRGLVMHDAIRDAIDQSFSTLRITPNTTYLDDHKRHRLNATISTNLIERGLVVPEIDEIVTGSVGSMSEVDMDRFVDDIAASTNELVTFGDAPRMLSKKLDGLIAISPELRFEDHESEGMLPLAAKVGEARSLLREFRSLRENTPSERTVNSAFFTETAEGELVQMAQETARLTPGALVHFGINIGEKDELTVTLGSTTFLEEVIRPPWGLWLEIGVTAIDFDLEGDPVQRVWLPPTDGTDLVTFAVRARDNTAVPGIARLRFSIYRDNNIVQSFLVGAVLEGAGIDVARSMAYGLNAGEADVRALGERGFLMRLEYSATPVVQSESVEPRALSVVANDIAGQKVVTFKNEDLFTVTIDPNLPDHVKAARKALNEASLDTSNLYRYVNENKGSRDELLGVLWDVAESGWKIYDSFVKSEDGQRKVRERLEQGGGIHAAHIDASTTIPWSLVYDRFVRDRQKKADIDGVVRSVERAFCFASMPAEDGTMPAVDCFGPGCVLDPAENARRRAANESILCEETVICPRRFWGFMFPIEVPAQQVAGVAGEAPPPIPKTIDAGQPVNIAIAFNPNLTQGPPHRSKLETLTQGRATLVPPPYDGIDGVVDLLNDTNPDIVYFFCHAIDALATKGPSLDFGRGYDAKAPVADRIKDVLEASEFTGTAWRHTPLVFMNGCGSVGFSPYAPSEFVKKFISRQASAVIGTEVTVWETLAREFAELFFRRFLDGSTNAGDAMLAARRALLAKNNPLGLIYTLFGSSQLRLA